MLNQSSKRGVLCSGRPATEHFTNRVFGLPSHLFFPHHTALLQGLRAQLTPAHLPHHARGLLLGLETHAQAVLGSSSKVNLLASGVWPLKLWGIAFTVRWHQCIVRHGSHSVAWMAGCSFQAICCAVLFAVFTHLALIPAVDFLLSCCPVYCRTLPGAGSCSLCI